MQFKNTLFIAITASWAAFASHAVTVLADQTVSTSGITFNNTTSDPIERPEVVGTNLANDILDFSLILDGLNPLRQITGSLQNLVLANSDGNHVFMPRIRDLDNFFSGTLAITSIELFGYAGVTTDVAFRLDGLGDKGFTSVSRSADGDALRLNYDDPLFADLLTPPGLREDSLFPAILTDATDFDLNGSAIIRGVIVPSGERDTSNPVTSPFLFSVLGLAAPVAPTAGPTPVPLPASAYLLLGALGVGGWVSRRRGSLAEDT